MDLKEVKNILIIGVAGGLAKITAGLIAKTHPHINITGVDSRPIDKTVHSPNMNYVRMKYTRSNFEKIFRNNQFDVVFHLGRMSHANANPRAHLAQRLDLNVMGTNRILELSLKFNVRKVIILSTFHVYGAFAENPVFLKEDSLLKASINYPELRDVVEMDQLASNWLWKYQHELETVVLRPCNIIGPQISNSMTKYLTTPYAPVPVDFNPTVQFIHEFDMANLLLFSIDGLPSGIYNATTNESISIREAKKIVGAKYVSVPIFLLEPAAKLINKTLWSVPDYLIDYLKYSVLLSNSQIQEHLPENFFRFTTRESLELLQMD